MAVDPSDSSCHPGRYADAGDVDAADVDSSSCWAAAAADCVATSFRREDAIAYCFVVASFLVASFVAVGAVASCWAGLVVHWVDLNGHLAAVAAYVEASCGVAVAVDLNDVDVEDDVAAVSADAVT